MTRVLAFHKPKGLLTTHRDELGRETVYDRLRQAFPGERQDWYPKWHAIGRLDADTTGLLLFTDDGALLHHATQPASKVDKVYRVLAKGLLSEAQLTALREGVELSGGLGRSGQAKVELIGFQVATTWIDITIAEGKNRQVRRMLLAVDSQVIRLCRVQVGTLRLHDLVPEEGGFRELDASQIRAGLNYEPVVVSARKTSVVSPGGARRRGPGKPS